MTVFVCECYTPVVVTRRNMQCVLQHLYATSCVQRMRPTQLCEFSCLLTPAEHVASGNDDRQQYTITEKNEKRRSPMEIFFHFCILLIILIDMFFKLF